MSIIRRAWLSAALGVGCLLGSLGLAVLQPGEPPRLPDITYYPSTTQEPTP